jgi:tyrosyl-tRNA synthetase
MDLEKRLALVREVGEEIVTEEELRLLLESKKSPVAYDGFEPSGQVHVAQGIMRAINIEKMVKAGCRFKMLVADWHAMANKKLSGDLENIQAAGKYLIETWNACGLDTKKVEFVWASELVAEPEYWKKVMGIAVNSTVKRITRCSQIMGRKESEALSASQIFYPCMQAADIFHLECDITQLGMDQRKVNMLAREIGEKLGFWKPVVVSHHMLMGLQLPKSSAQGKEREIELKMSKSVPDSAIFMTDSEQEIKRKISKAYCPEKQVEENPVMEYARHLVFEKFEKMKVERPAKFGGNTEYCSYQELQNNFATGKLHPADLKNATAFYINEMLEPVRKHFSKGKAKKLLDQVKGFEVTR